MGRRNRRMSEQRYENKSMVPDERHQLQHLLQKTARGENSAACTDFANRAENNSIEFIDGNTAVRTDTATANSSVCEKVMIRKNGIEIELPQEVSEKMLLILLRGLQEC